MRPLATLSALALTLVLAGSAVARTTFAFTGHGYGHGVGMGQWGAEGYAQHGWTYDRILAHYYQGTTLGQAPVKRIKVLLAAARSTVSIHSDSPFTAHDARGAVRLHPGTYQLGPELTITAGGKKRSFESPLRFRPGGTPLVFGRAYRDTLVVQVVGGSLSVVNDVTLEHYVDAVVPHEMPVSWNPEALKAQAVAARTYAIVNRKPRTYYDFAANPVAQAYEGADLEQQQTDAAVAATKGEIVLYQGDPAWTFYSSSSGGKTAALSDAYPGGKDLPYLTPVADPYDGLSPYHDWGPVLYSPTELASRLGLPGPPARLSIRRTPSGRVGTLVAKGSGWTKEIPGPTVRTSLGLRSTWFDVARRHGARSGSAG